APFLFFGTAALNANGSVYSNGSIFVDSNARAIGSLSFQDVFAEYSPLSLQKLNDSGTLLYMPYAGNIDIYDVTTGALLRRVALTETLPAVTDAIAIDSSGQTIYLVTSRGLTILDLGSVP